MVVKQLEIIELAQVAANSQDRIPDSKVHAGAGAGCDVGEGVGAGAHLGGSRINQRYVNTAWRSALRFSTRFHLRLFAPLQSWSHGGEVWNPHWTPDTAWALSAPHVSRHTPVLEGWLTMRRMEKKAWRRYFFVATNRRHNFRVYYFDKVRVCATKSVPCSCGCRSCVCQTVCPVFCASSIPCSLPPAERAQSRVFKGQGQHAVV